MKARPKPNELALTVRVPRNVLDQIDFLVKLRRSKIPRHSWLLEAIYEKLARETKMTNEGSLDIYWENNAIPAATRRYRLIFLSYSPECKGGVTQPKRIVGSDALETYLRGLRFDPDDAKLWVEKVNTEKSVSIDHVIMPDDELAAVYGYIR